MSKQKLGEMRERPILFSAEMVRAILDGRKTMTRRVVKEQPVLIDGLWHVIYGDWDAGHGIYDTESEMFAEYSRVVKCPYGKVGDRLCFIGTWAVAREYDKVRPSRLRKDVKVWHVYQGIEKPEWCGRSRPGRFMPLWIRSQMPKADITDVRVERLQEITTKDCIAEGIYPIGNEHDPRIPKTEFMRLWDKINGKRENCSWADNPFVWVVEFRKVEAR